MTDSLQMYDDLAAWWPLLSSPEDYAEEAAFYTRQLLARVPDEQPTLLELGSGGGNNASHMKAHFDAVTLVDRSRGMLDVSRELNPECEHAVGDMRSVRLVRSFDCVFVHDAICYASTLEDLRAVFETAFAHCRPGGAALFAPDFVRESFRPGTSHGGHDGDGRGLRYLEWTWDPDPDDTSYVVDYALVLRDEEGAVRVRHDRHLEGLFAERTWLSFLEAAGFRARAVSRPDPDESGGTPVLVGVRPPSAHPEDPT